MEKRDIRFRGLTKTGIWVYGYYTHDVYRNDSGDIIKDVHVIMNYDEYGEQQDHEIKIETLGQFTGLIDTEGVEVYEGDVVKVKSDPNYYEIFWCKENFGFCYKIKDSVVSVNFIKSFEFRVEYRSINNIA